MRPSRFSEEQIIAILRWSQETRVEWHYIAPGKPAQSVLNGIGSWPGFPTASVLRHQPRSWNLPCLKPISANVPRYTNPMDSCSPTLLSFGGTIPAKAE